MSKYTIFFPSDVDLSDKVKDTILWQAKYKLQDENYVTADFVDKINSTNDPPLPMTHWKHWMEGLGLSLLYDFSYLKENIDLLEISNKTSFPFSNNYKTKETLGIDRLVLSAGAVLNFENQNRLIIDAGTCITYDYINSKNVYLGGAISPGLSLRYKSLNNYTAKLPLLENKEINYLIGKSTSESIYSGVINGVINEIDGFITQYKELDKDLTIILTGGDAEFLAKSIKNTIFANSNFLLESLNNLYTYCKNKND